LRANRERREQERHSLERVRWSGWRRNARWRACLVRRTARSARTVRVGRTFLSGCCCKGGHARNLGREWGRGYFERLSELQREYL
jgi:hypothetical protein